MTNQTRTCMCTIVLILGVLIVGCASATIPATSTPVPAPAPSTLSAMPKSSPAPIPVTAETVAAPTLSPAALEMIKTVQAFEDARNRGDTDAHVALVTIPKQEQFRGKAERYAGMGVQKQIADCSATNDRVICKGKMRSGVLPCGFSELQFDSVEYVFRDGKIDTATYSFSQDSYGAYYPFEKALMAYIAKNHLELLNDMGKMTREASAIMVTMTKEYCASEK